MNIADAVAEGCARLQLASVLCAAADQRQGFSGAEFPIAAVLVGLRFVQHAHFRQCAAAE